MCALPPSPIQTRTRVKGQKNIYTVRMYNSAMKVAGGYSTAGLSVTIPKTGTAVGTPKLTAIRSTAYNKIALSWGKGCKRHALQGLL